MNIQSTCYSIIGLSVTAILVSTPASAARPYSWPLEVEVNNFPEVQTVEVNNFPDSVDVNIISKETLTVRGSVTTEAISGSNRQTVLMRSMLNPGLSTNYGSVPTGKKLVITDIMTRHAVNTSTEITNLILSMARVENGCSGGPFSHLWEIFVSPGESKSDHFTTGIEIPPNYILCAASTQGVRLRTTVIGYIADL